VHLRVRQVGGDQRAHVIELSFGHPMPLNVVACLQVVHVTLIARLELFRSTQDLRQEMICGRAFLRTSAAE